MNKARLAVLAIALITAIGAAVLVSNMSGGDQQVVVEAPKVETVKVLVAAKDINLGTLLTPADMVWHDWPKSAVSNSLITQSTMPKATTDLKGATVRAPFVQGEPIISRKVIRPDQGGFMAAILPKGMRAISVKISVESGAGGFILPNDRVDLLLTRRVRIGGQSTREEHFTETVLKNVRILAIDQTFSDNGKGEQVVVGKTATLELLPEQAEILSLAEAMGDISLALRSIKENSNMSLSEIVPQAAGSLSDNGRNAGAVTMLRYGVATTVNSRR